MKCCSRGPSVNAPWVSSTLTVSWALSWTFFACTSILLLVRLICGSKLVTWSKGVPIGSTGIFPGGSHQVIPTESGLKSLTWVSLFQVLTLAAIHRTSTFFLFLASMLRSREDNKSASDWIPADRRRRKFSSVIVSLLAIRQPSVSKQLARVGRKAPL